MYCNWEIRTEINGIKIIKTYRSSNFYCKRFIRTNKNFEEKGIFKISIKESTIPFETSVKRTLT